MNPSAERFLSLVRRFTQRRGLIFGGILLLALFAFEIFNYSTTEFALTDMLGANLRFLGLRWATILSLAFCGIDFAGIARLFTPQLGNDEPAQTWYLFAAWLLAAVMNATLTWWGVAIAVRSHQELSSLVIGQSTLTRIVPVFVALMVWLIRVLIIGTFSMAGDRLFSLVENRPARIGNVLQSRPAPQPLRNSNPPSLVRPLPSPFRSAPKPEPSYHPVTLAASPHNADLSIRR